MNIKDEIRKLIDLQNIDSRILALRKEAEIEKPKAVSELKNNLESQKTIISSLGEELKRIQVTKKEKELDLQTREDAVRKYQGQLYQLKTNQEYKAKMKEIESAKADVSVVEEDIIRILDRIDEKTRELNENKKKMAREEKKINEDLKRTEDEIKELQIKIKNLEDKKGILARQIDANILTRYQYLLENRQGLALVPLRDGSCGGCFLNLPDETTNRIKHYKEIISCEMCARMLYLEEDFNA